jgi:hypothetical protein
MTKARVVEHDRRSMPNFLRTDAKDYLAIFRATVACAG